MMLHQSAGIRRCRPAIFCFLLVVLSGAVLASETVARLHLLQMNLFTSMGHTRL